MGPECGPPGGFAFLSKYRVRHRQEVPRKRRPGAASLRSASPLGDAEAGVRLGPFSRHTLDTPLISQSRLGNVESSLQRVPLGAHMREWQERGMCAWKAHAPEAAAAPPASGGGAGCGWETSPVETGLCFDAGSRHSPVLFPTRH